MADRLTRVITYSESEYSTKLLSNNQHSIEYSYDEESRITGARTKFSYLAGTALTNKTLTHTYNYLDNGMLSNCSINTDGLNINVTYTYDNYLRPSSKTVHEDDFTNVVTYGYYENDSVITNEIRSYKTAVNGTETYYTYIYDGRGNIITVKRGYVTAETYEYDDLGQLIEAYADECVHKYEYDKDGNILKIDYKVEPTDEIIYTHNFTYTDDAVWGKRLTGFNNESITYDEYGRTSYYRGKQIYYFWDNRFNRIESFGNASFTYYEDDLRRTKTVGGVTHYYTYDGINLIKEEWGDNVLVFLYDDSGSPVGMQYRNSTYASGVWDTYYYEKNLQGDIIAVYNAAGTKLVTYKYDPWGNFTRTDVASNVPDVVKNNPITYRGYYYDHDLDLYYLATRYYDPETCRFVTADNPAVLTATPMGLTDKNLYAYCDNNPVMRADNGGEFWHIVVGAAIGGAFEIGSQLIANGGDFTSINWAKVGVATAVGGITSACGPGAGALITGLGNAAIELIDQQEKGNKDINKVIVSFGIGVVSSLLGSGVGELTKKVGGAIKLHNLSKKSPGFIKATVLDTIEVAGKHRNAIKNLSWAQKAYPQLSEALLGKTIPQAFNSTIVGLAGYGTMGAVYGFK